MSREKVLALVLGFVAIATGDSHSLALRGDGSIVSWEADSWDQVTDTPSGSSFITIAAGGLHSLAIMDLAG